MHLDRSARLQPIARSAVWYDTVVSDIENRSHLAVVHMEMGRCFVIVARSAESTFLFLTTVLVDVFLCTVCLIPLCPTPLYLIPFVSATMVSDSAMPDAIISDADTVRI